MNSFIFNSTGQRRHSPRSLLGTFLLLLMVASSAFAQAPTASVAPTTAQLEKLVGPIALYPDDLVAIILPGATYPLEIVQADRFLDKRKSDKNLKVNDAWQDSIKSLLNYPDVVKKMSTDLDWTTDLGEAVVAITSYSALVEAEAAIAFGALVKVGTDGKAITGTAADHCGRALGAATQPGQLIEVQLYKHVHA